MNNLAGGARGGDGGAMVRTVIFGLSSRGPQNDHENNLFSITRELWVGGFGHVPVFSRAEGEERVFRRIRRISAGK